MLSRKVASTIIQRAESLAAKEDKYEIALFSEEEIKSCGISNSKPRAIKLFVERYRNDEDKYENWRILDGTAPAKAVPHRSYLALYLWEIVD